MTGIRLIPTVLSVQVGRIAPLGPKGVPSGFVKRPVVGPIHVGRLNLDGDSQADLRVHGGPDKAVYAYPASRYEEWLDTHPEHRSRLVAGAFGENLTIAALTEHDICAGDVHAIGTARLQVCQPRQPCLKLALSFEDAGMPRAMVRTRRSGWYYRVLEEGVLQAGDAVACVERPHPDLPFTRLVDIVYGGRATAQERRAIAEADGIARRLRQVARREAVR